MTRLLPCGTLLVVAALTLALPSAEVVRLARGVVGFVGLVAVVAFFVVVFFAVAVVFFTVFFAALVALRRGVVFLVGIFTLFSRANCQKKAGDGQYDWPN